MVHSLLLLAIIKGGHKIIQLIRDIAKDATDLGYDFGNMSLLVWNDMMRIWIVLYKIR